MSAPFSTFSTDGVDSLFAFFGKPGTYTPPGGPAVEDVEVVVRKGAHLVTNDAGRVIATRDVLVFKRSDYDPPASGATWVYGSSTWRVGPVIDRMADRVLVEGIPEA